SLGCTLFYLVTGRPPFRRGTEDEDKYLKVVARHLREPAPDPRRSQADVDPELAELALAMMRKPPEERPGYPEGIDRLEEVRGRLVPRASGVARAVKPELDAPPPRRSGWLWAITAASAAVFLVGAGLTLLAPRPEPAAVSARDGGAAARPDEPTPP